MAPIKPKDPWHSLDSAFDKFDSAFDKIDDLLELNFDGTTYNKSISKLKIKLEELKKRQASISQTPSRAQAERFKNSINYVEREFQRSQEALARRSKRAIRNLIVFTILFVFIFITIIMGEFLANKKEVSPPSLVESSAPLNPTLDEKPSSDIPTLKVD